MIHLTFRITYRHALATINTRNYSNASWPVQNIGSSRQSSHSIEYGLKSISIQWGCISIHLRIKMEINSDSIVHIIFCSKVDFYTYG